MSTGQATLDGYALPRNFHYQRPRPRKRFNALQTFGDVKFQFTTGDHVVPEDSVINWDLEECQSVVHALQAKYNETGFSTYTFVGYWGDEYTVKFINFDNIPVEATLHKMTGQFQIVTVIDWGDA